MEADPSAAMSNTAPAVPNPNRPSSSEPVSAMLTWLSAFACPAAAGIEANGLKFLPSADASTLLVLSSVMKIVPSAGRIAMPFARASRVTRCGALTTCAEPQPDNVMTATAVKVLASASAFGQTAAKTAGRNAKKPSYFPYQCVGRRPPIYRLVLALSAVWASTCANLNAAYSLRTDSPAATAA